MTATDNLKSALSAWVDETETNISGLKSGLGSVDATVSALQTELASGQADVANIKTDIASLKASVAALTPAPVDSPPPAPVPDPAKVFVVLDPSMWGYLEAPPAANYPHPSGKCFSQKCRVFGLDRA